jgi:hypothetical protein
MRYVPNTRLHDEADVRRTSRDLGITEAAVRKMLQSGHTVEEIYAFVRDMEKANAERWRKREHEAPESARDNIRLMRRSHGRNYRRAAAAMAYRERRRAPCRSTRPTRPGRAVVSRRARRALRSAAPTRGDPDDQGDPGPPPLESWRCPCWQCEHGLGAEPPLSEVVE